MQATYQNIIRLKYLGNDRYTASWRGWPSQGNKRINKRVTCEPRELAEVSAIIFAEWLKAGPPKSRLFHGKYKNGGQDYEILTLTQGDDTPDITIIGVTLGWKERKE